MAALNLEQVKQLLYDQRYTIHSWATRHGFNPNTVDKSLRRSLAAGKRPRGFIGRAAVKGIEKTIKRNLFEDATGDHS